MENLQTKISLFRFLFKGREDVFATRWEKKSGYMHAYFFDPYHYRTHNMKGGTFRNNQKLVSQLHKELFDYLKAVGARFPKKDPEYSSEAERKYLDGVVKNRLPQLEQQRLKFLAKDFDPKNNWWGSKVTKD